MEEPRPPRPLIEPFRLLLAGVCAIYSVAALLNFEKLGSPAIKALDDRTQAVVFLVGLTISGVFSVQGTLRRRPVQEGIGMFALSGFWLSFAILGWWNSGGRAAAFSSFLMAFAIGGFWVFAQHLLYDRWRSRRARRARAGGA